MTLYIKEGRRYIAVRDTDACEGLSNGAWLVVVKDGRRSIKQALKPRYVDIQAACYGAETLLVDKLVELNKQKRLKCDKKLTEKQADAWNKLRRVLYPEAERKHKMAIIETPSEQEIINEFLKFLEEKVSKEFEEKNW